MNLNWKVCVSTATVLVAVIWGSRLSIHAQELADSVNSATDRDTAREIARQQIDTWRKTELAPAKKLARLRQIVATFPSKSMDLLHDTFENGDATSWACVHDIYVDLGPSGVDDLLTYLEQPRSSSRNPVDGIVYGILHELAYQSSVIAQSSSWHQSCIERLFPDPLERALLLESPSQITGLRGAVGRRFRVNAIARVSVGSEAIQPTAEQSRQIMELIRRIERDDSEASRILAEMGEAAAHSVGQTILTTHNETLRSRLLMVLDSMEVNAWPAHAALVVVAARDRSIEQRSLALQVLARLGYHPQHTGLAFDRATHQTQSLLDTKMTRHALLRSGLGPNSRANLMSALHLGTTNQPPEVIHDLAPWVDLMQQQRNGEPAQLLATLESLRLGQATGYELIQPLRRIAWSEEHSLQTRAAAIELLGATTRHYGTQGERYSRNDASRQAGAALTTCFYVADEQLKAEVAIQLLGIPFDILPSTLPFDETRGFLRNQIATYCHSLYSLVSSPTPNQSGVDELLDKILSIGRVSGPTGVPGRFPLTYGAVSSLVVLVCDEGASQPSGSPLVIRPGSRGDRALQILRLWRCPLLRDDVRMLSRILEGQRELDRVPAEFLELFVDKDIFLPYAPALTGLDRFRIHFDDISDQLVAEILSEASESSPTRGWNSPLHRLRLRILSPAPEGDALQRFSKLFDRADDSVKLQILAGLPPSQTTAIPTGFPNNAVMFPSFSWNDERSKAFGIAILRDCLETDSEAVQSYCIEFIAEKLTKADVAEVVPSLRAIVQRGQVLSIHNRRNLLTALTRLTDDPRLAFSTTDVDKFSVVERILYDGARPDRKPDEPISPLVQENPEACLLAATQELQHFLVKKQMELLRHRLEQEELAEFERKVNAGEIDFFPLINLVGGSENPSTTTVASGSGSGFDVALAGDEPDNDQPHDDESQKDESPDDGPQRFGPLAGSDADLRRYERLEKQFREGSTAGLGLPVFRRYDDAPLFSEAQDDLWIQRALATVLTNVVDYMEDRTIRKIGLKEIGRMRDTVGKCQIELSGIQWAAEKMPDGTPIYGARKARHEQDARLSQVHTRLSKRIEEYRRSQVPIPTPPTLLQRIVASFERVWSNPWARPFLVGGALFGTGMSLAFLLWFFKPLWLLEASLILEEHSVALWGGVPLPLAHLLGVGFFRDTQRVSDAWVKDNIDTARAAFQRVWTVQERALHIASPIRIEQQLVAAPRPGDFRNLFDPTASNFLIVGEGGSGKTSLACQFGHWAMDERNAHRLASHLMIPVLLEEEFPTDSRLGQAAGTQITIDADGLEQVLKGNNDRLIDAVCGELVATFGSAGDIPRSLVEQLLRQRRILLIVDHYSEMSEDSRAVITPSRPGFPAKAMVVTSRAVEKRLGSNIHVIRPLRVERKRLIGFVDAYLELTGTRHLFEGERGDDELDLAQRMKDVVARREVTILIARMFLDSEIARARGESGVDRPDSVAKLMLQHIAWLNRSADGLPNSELLKCARQVGWACLKHDLRPSSVSVARLQKNSHVAMEQVDRLVALGVLVWNSLKTELRFSLDPVAEYMAALHLIYTRRDSREKWQSFLALLEESQRDAASAGMLAALRECCQEPEHQIPESVRVAIFRDDVPHAA